MTHPTPTNSAADLPTALRMALDCEALELDGIAAELRRLHAYAQELEAQVIVDCMTHDSAALAGVQPAPAAVQPVAPSDPQMPETWHVIAHVHGEPILSIGYDWLSGKGELNEAETQAVVGMAQHLLSFVGYGLPPSNFDPDADDQAQTIPAQQPAPAAVQPVGGFTSWNQAPCAHCGKTEGKHFNARCHHMQGETWYTTTTPAQQPAPAREMSIEQEAMQMLWDDQQAEEKEHYRNVARGAELPLYAIQNPEDLGKADRAAHAAQAPAVPAVGVPTEAMIDAGNRARLYREHGDLRDEGVLSARAANTRATWFAMCAVAHQPAASAQGAGITAGVDGAAICEAAALKWEREAAKHKRKPGSLSSACEARDMARAKLCRRLADQIRAAAPLPTQAAPSPELTWLYTHCRAVGMDCKSDSGKWEHDIALFVVKLQEQAAQRPDAGVVEDALIEALELGLECAQEVAANFHEAYKGHRPHDHTAVDADVEKIKTVLAAARAAQEDPAQGGA